MMIYRFGGTLQQMGLIGSYEKLYRELLNRLIETENKNFKESVGNFIEREYEQYKQLKLSERKKSLREIEVSIKEMIDHKVIKP
jgi:hypothetical protein